jgi:hypothetical protein
MKKDYIIAGLGLIVVYLLWDKNKGKTASLEALPDDVSAIEINTSECRKAAEKVVAQKRLIMKMSDADFNKW